MQQSKGKGPNCGSQNTTQKPKGAAKTNVINTQGTAINSCYISDTRRVTCWKIGKNSYCVIDVYTMKEMLY